MKVHITRVRSISTTCQDVRRHIIQNSSKAMITPITILSKYVPIIYNIYSNLANPLRIVVA